MINYKRPPIAPIVYGGGHERELSPGMLPVALIVGFDRACEIAEQEHSKVINQYYNTKEQIMKELNNSGVEFENSGYPKFCMPNTLNVSFPGVDYEALMLVTKYYCSAYNGSICTSHYYSHSHVLT